MQLHGGKRFYTLLTPFCAILITGSAIQVTERFVIPPRGGYRVRPIGHVFRIPAILYGADTVSSCTVETWQERSSSGRTINRCRILNEPPDLPDGPYQVEFAGHTVSTYRLLGHFELSFVTFDIDLDQAA